MEIIVILIVLFACGFTGFVIGQHTTYARRDYQANIEIIGNMRECMDYLTELRYTTLENSEQRRVYLELVDTLLADKRMVLAIRARMETAKNMPPLDLFYPGHIEDTPIDTPTKRGFRG